MNPGLSHCKGSALNYSGVFQPWASIKAWKRHLAKVSTWPSQEQSMRCDTCFQVHEGGREKTTHLLHVVRAMEAAGTQEAWGEALPRGLRKASEQEL